MIPDLEYVFLRSFFRPWYSSSFIVLYTHITSGGGGEKGKEEGRGKRGRERGRIEKKKKKNLIDHPFYSQPST